MKKQILLLFWAVCIVLPLFSQERGKINIPDLKGYVTLKCDFHIHTIFSDGTVWPTVRVEEAYREGLDVISITDHIYPETGRRRYLQDIEKLSDISFKGLSYNISYELAQPVANEVKNIYVMLKAKVDEYPDFYPDKPGASRRGNYGTFYDFAGPQNPF